MFAIVIIASQYLLPVGGLGVCVGPPVVLGVDGCPGPGAPGVSEVIPGGEPGLAPRHAHGAAHALTHGPGRHPRHGGARGHVGRAHRGHRAPHPVWRVQAGLHRGPGQPAK